MQIGFDGTRKLIFEAPENKCIYVKPISSKKYFIHITEHNIERIFPDFHNEVEKEIKKICYLYECYFLKRNNVSQENFDYVNEMFNEMWDKQQIILNLINKNDISIIDIKDE